MLHYKSCSDSTKVSIQKLSSLISDFSKCRLTHWSAINDRKIASKKVEEKTHTQTEKKKTHGFGSTKLFEEKKKYISNLSFSS